MQNRASKQSSETKVPQLRPGMEVTVKHALVDQACRTLWRGGYQREDAEFLMSQAVKSVCEAIVRDGFAAFPLKVVLLRTDGRDVTVIEKRRG